MGYLDNTGLAYFWEKIKSNFFSGTKEIPANADLDDYKTPGVYNCPQNTTVETLSNAPAPYAFSMRVYKTTNGNGCIQYISTYNTGLASQPDQDRANRLYTRTYYPENSWSPWVQIVTSLDKPVDYTSVGYTTATFADYCWHKVATIKYTNSNNDRRVVFSVIDSFWGSSAPNGRPDMKYGLLHVHIRKTDNSIGTGCKLTWNLNTGYDPKDFLLIYDSVNDQHELWTMIPNRYNFRTFNIIENGSMYGGNRYQINNNPVEMYGRIRDADGYATHPSGDGYTIITSESSIIEQSSRGVLDLGCYFNKVSTRRLTSANNLPVGLGELKYFNSTSAMTQGGKPTRIPVSEGTMDAHVIHLPWDGENGYDSQLAIPNLCGGSSQADDVEYMYPMAFRGGYGQTGTLEDGTKVQTGWGDWIHLVDERYVLDGIRPDRKYVSRYGVCSTAAATAVKTVDIPGFKLRVGAYVIVNFTNTNSAAVADLELNVSNTGDIPIKYRNANLAAVGDLIANRPFMFVYDGTNWQLGIDIDKNTNNYERLRTYYPIKAKSAITTKHVIVADDNGLYFMLTSGSPFSTKYPPLYATSAISANAKSTNAYYFCYLDADVITNEAAETLTLNKALYIKGHLNGTTFTPFATKSLVCTEPTTEDGYQYLKLGVVKAASTSSDTLRAQIEIEHPIYEYVNGSFCPYEPKASNSDIDSIFD